MGTELGFSVYGTANDGVTQNRALRDLRRRKWQEIGEKYLLGSFIKFTEQI